MIKSSIAAAILAVSTVSALSQSRVEVGLLDCVVQGGLGYVIGSSKDVDCTFHPATRQRPNEIYSGRIDRLGVDLGITGKTVLQWAVYAPTKAYAPGALAGSYVGASADASALVGVGANVLVGGSGQTFSLQPISVQAQTGINVAAGVSRFTLFNATPEKALK